MDKSNAPLRLYDFENKTTTEIPLIEMAGSNSGHGGGNHGIIQSAYEFFCGEYKGFSVSDIQISADNHLIVFAAEESRAKGIVVDFEEYLNSLKNNL